MTTHKLHLSEFTGHETQSEKETKAILAMAEGMRTLEQQLADAQKRIRDLEQLLSSK
jgi:hypothetical protein